MSRNIHHFISKHCSFSLVLAYPQTSIYFVLISSSSLLHPLLYHYLRTCQMQLLEEIQCTSHPNWFSHYNVRSMYLVRGKIVCDVVLVIRPQLSVPFGGVIIVGIECWQWKWWEGENVNDKIEVRLSFYFLWVSNENSSKRGESKARVHEMQSWISGGRQIPNLAQFKSSVLGIKLWALKLFLLSMYSYRQ